MTRSIASPMADRLSVTAADTPLGATAACKVILALDLQDEHLAVGEADDEVGPEFPHHAVVDVQDLEAQVVVLRPYQAKLLFGPNGSGPGNQAIVFVLHRGRNAEVREVLITVLE